MKHAPTSHKPSQSKHAQESHYYYLSDHGEVIYAPTGSPTGPAGQEPVGQDPRTRRSADSLDDTRLYGPCAPSGSAERASSVPFCRRPSFASSGSGSSIGGSSTSGSSIKNEGEHRAVSPDTYETVERPRLGLPKDWIIYALSKSHSSKDEDKDALHKPPASPPTSPPPPSSPSSPSSTKHGFFEGLHHLHLPFTSRDKTVSDTGIIDPKRIDYSKPLAFELSTEYASPAPSYRSERSFDSSPPPPYPGSPSINLVPEAEQSAHVPPLDPTTTPEHKSCTTNPHADTSKTHQPTPPTTHDPLKEKPKLAHTRALPREFTEQELLEIRRKTRHCIRVVTRSSIGLTATLALSSVAPQLLIAAAVNAYCLGRGAHQLHRQLQFLRVNELNVRKRDVILAISEGVLVKIAFMAITINHDDFIILAHEILGPNALPLISLVQAHAVPGLGALNELFIRPMEHVQGVLGLPTMAERAVGTVGALHAVGDVAGAGVAGGLGAEGVGSVFGLGGWDSANVALLVENVFAVGAVQAVMEHLVEEVQERIGRATVFVRERLEWKVRRRRIRREEKMYERIECETEDGGGGRSGVDMGEKERGRGRDVASFSGENRSRDVGDGKVKLNGLPERGKSHTSTGKAKDPAHAKEQM